MDDDRQRRRRADRARRWEVGVDRLIAGNPQRSCRGVSAVDSPQEIDAVLAGQALLVRVGPIRDRNLAQEVLELLGVRPGLPLCRGGLLGTGRRAGVPGELPGLAL